METLTLGQGLHWDYLRGPSPASLHADYPMNYDHSEISDKHYFIVTATCQKEQWREIIYKNYFYVHAKNVRQVEGNIAVKIAPICIQISLQLKIMRGNNNRMGPRITMIGIHYC